MPIRSVENIVKSKLPFLEDNQATNDTIEAYRIEMCYFLQDQTGKADNEVEPEGNYKPLENMLFACMVAYHMGKDQVVKVTGGVNGQQAVNKTLKKAKADVVESEFMIVKASDGASWSIPTEAWFKALLKDICDKSRALNIENPMCFNKDDLIPEVPYVIGEDFPESPDPYKLLGGTIFG